MEFNHLNSAFLIFLSWENIVSPCQTKVLNGDFYNIYLWLLGLREALYGKCWWLFNLHQWKSIQDIKHDLKLLL